jgi:hypothetical protein
MDVTNAQAVAWFDLGESRVYEYETDKYEIDRRDSLNHKRMVRDVTMTVVDSTEVSYTIELRFSNYRTVDTVADMFLNTLMKDVRVFYMTDELGTFTKILNLDEVIGQINVFFNSPKSLYEDVSVAQRLRLLFEIYGNKVVVAGMIQKFISQFHYCHGAAFVLDEPYVSEYEGPIVDGSDILMKRVLSACLIEISPELDKYTVSISERIGPESLTKAVAGIASPMDERVAEALEEMLENETKMNLSGEMRGTITLDNRGWVENSVTEKIVSDENNGSVESITIRPK